MLKRSMCFLVIACSAGGLGAVELGGEAEQITRLPLSQEVPVSPGLEKAIALIQYDDGSSEGGVFCSPGGQCEYGMRFDSGDLGSGFDFGVDICFLNSGASVDDFLYEVRLYAANGGGGAPSSLRASFQDAVDLPTGQTTVIPSLNYETTGEALVVIVRTSTDAYDQIFLCADFNGPETQPIWFRQNLAGAWTASGLSKALLIRGTISTPPPILEVHYVPFFLVDTLTMGGTSTFFSLRNEKEMGGIIVDVSYYDVLGVLQANESYMLGPSEVRSIDIRSKVGLGLPVDPDGFARGYVEILTGNIPGEPDKIAGDFFQLDVANNFATGDRLVSHTDLCDQASVRFLKLAPSDPTRLRVFLFSPRGTGPMADPSFVVRSYNQLGVFDQQTQVFSSSKVRFFEDSSFSSNNFGLLEFDFTNSLGGVVYAEYSAFGLFSVGLQSQCR